MDVFKSSIAKKLLDNEAAALHEDQSPFLLGVHTRLDFLLRNPSNKQPLYELGCAALNAFVQATITGPPLEFSPEDSIFPRAYPKNSKWRDDLLQDLLESLAVEGQAAYKLTQHIVLFWLAKTILTHQTLCDNFAGLRARARVNFLHQKLLSERSESLQKSILSDYESLDGKAQEVLSAGELDADELASLHVERASILIYYDLDVKARSELAEAARKTNFAFILTGKLGRRTKFQDRDISQLVVLARSSTSNQRTRENMQVISNSNGGPKDTETVTQPKHLDLNDDTLLESISFKKDTPDDRLMPEVQDAESLPASLAETDAEDQPLLNPLDAIILLNTASSISNTNPSDGLTREETLPYATRVLQGGSSNWQVYTQALLVRSRIEGYKSRTAERGLLQLQALVDQVIADTTGANIESGETADAAATFLPRPKATESAPASERLKYVWQLNSPMRWELEAELAARWVNVGGLRTALDIYERLQMWAEAALCLAATDQEGKAIRIIRGLLYESSDPATLENETQPTSNSPERNPLPSDAPRLFCILGDLENNPHHYERAWSVSNQKYARAQRSLARHFVKSKDLPKAAEAYGKSLKIIRLNSATWFALGCVQLELQDWPAAVDSFTRTIQLDDTDGEAWSNLAAALVRLPAPPPPPPQPPSPPLSSSSSPSSSPSLPPQQQQQQPRPHRHNPLLDALNALRHAARLLHSSPRIWDNYLTISSSIPPPHTPFPDIILAQRRVIELRGPAIGESAVDTRILAMLVDHVTTTTTAGEFPADERGSSSGGEGGGVGGQIRPGSVPAQLIDLMDSFIVPLITSSAELWLLVARLNAWRRRPHAALEAHEKAWRATLAKPGVFEEEEDGGKGWEEVVERTVGLVGAYGEFGGMVREREEEEDGGEEEGGKGEVVMKDWKFKARSAVRGAMGKGRERWGESAGWERLRGCLEGLKGSSTT
ncbi:MAG: hypothetical protein Q9227_001578 [Pyrenula ochraceoflavens]